MGHVDAGGAIRHQWFPAAQQGLTRILRRQLPAEVDLGGADLLPTETGVWSGPAVYRAVVTPRVRIAAFGTAGLLVVAGAVCGALISGLTGQLLTFVLISLGLGGAVLLLFLEVGLSEDRERAREERERQERDRRRREARLRSRPGVRPWPRRRGD